jgi:protein gp37
MGKDSKIEWTDHTFNPWLGCSKVSIACDHCYAERMGARMHVPWGVNTRRRKTKTWRDPVRWNKQAKKAATEGWHRRPKVFCGSLCDVFEARPELDEWRDELWELVAETTDLTWLLLTKRPMNVLHNVPPSWHDDWPGHVWVGTTVEDHPKAEHRLRYLCNIPAPVRFVSCEPLLGEVDFTRVRLTPYSTANVLNGEVRDSRGRIEMLQSLQIRPVDWVIAGGESGAKARITDPNWVRKLRDDCETAKTPFFFKQWGEWAPSANWDGIPDEDAPRDTGTVMLPVDPERPSGWSIKMRRVGKKNAGKLLDGHEWTQSPQVKP